MKVMLNGISMALSLSRALDVLLRVVPTLGLTIQADYAFQYMLKNWHYLEQYEKLEQIGQRLLFAQGLTPTERMAFLALVHDAIS